MNTAFAASIPGVSTVLPGETPGILIATPLAPPGAHPQFFRGQVRDPMLFRDHLLTLQEVVQARFYRPDLWRYLDPVVTAEPARVRMECFSSCCSVYGRADFEADLFDGYALLRRGTTNVNFNPAFVQGLGQLRPGQRAVLEMGASFVQVSTPTQQLTETKVKLPERWVKAFLQSQALWREANLWAEMSALNARQFLMAIRAGDDRPQFVTQTAQGIKVLPTRSHRDLALPVAGLHRLGLFKKLLPHLQGLQLYALPSGGTVWVALLPTSTFTLALSASVKHGFSGEGEALRSLSASPDSEALAFAQGLLPGLESFNLSELATLLEMPTAEVLPLVDTLAMAGLLGYDVRQARYFYRALPFGGITPERLKASRQLVGQQIEVESQHTTAAGVQAQGWVQGETATYHVALTLADGYLQAGRCTCQWFVTHGLQRGPCKHLLALRFQIESA
jgi:hypothetical protein